jgi:hypothetical protein
VGTLCVSVKKRNEMKTLIIIPILFFYLSCSDKSIKSVEKFDNSKEIQKEISENKIKLDSAQINDLQNEVMNEEAILFNGKLKRYFTIKEFENVFGKADSIKLISQEEPSCSYIFENGDGSKNKDDKYLYKDGSRFENTKKKVAVDEFRFLKGNFILFKGNKLNSNTSLSDLQKLFPKAIKTIETLEVYKEENLQVIQLREDENNISEGHINIFFKNGKLYFMHWWFPC